MHRTKGFRLACFVESSPPLAEQCCAVCKDCDKEYTEMTVNEIINGKVHYIDRNMLQHSDKGNRYKC